MFDISWYFRCDLGIFFPLHGTSVWCKCRQHDSTYLKIQWSSIWATWMEVFQQSLDLLSSLWPSGVFSGDKQRQGCRILLCERVRLPSISGVHAVAHLAQTCTFLGLTRHQNIQLQVKLCCSNWRNLRRHSYLVHDMVDKCPRPRG